jgi:hypothetical protein
MNSNCHELENDIGMKQGKLEINEPPEANLTSQNIFGFIWGGPECHSE